MKILIPVDGSEPAQRAIDAAARLGREAPVEVVLLHVRESPGYYGELPPFDYESIERTLRQREEALLETAAGQARRVGLTRLSTRTGVGPVAREIVQAADDAGVDLIAMGTRGLNALGGLFMGSVAQRVVHLARPPVMLVK